jgi:hypothetical protein
MLRLEPEDRRAVAELLQHPWWLWTAAALPFSLMPLYINHNRSNPTLNKKNRYAAAAAAENSVATAAAAAA